jgi:transposase
VRITAAFSRLLRLPGIFVRDVAFQADRVVVTVALRRRLLACPQCSFATAARYDTRPVASQWRHLDLGAWRLELRAVLPRVAARPMASFPRRCPSPGGLAVHP